MPKGGDKGVHGGGGLPVGGPGSDHGLIVNMGHFGKAAEGGDKLVYLFLLLLFLVHQYATSISISAGSTFAVSQTSMVTQ
jgi:hypothetical protein